MNLNKVDLNLFIVFDAIYTEANLTRAGQIVGITQPAVSNALARLRETFNDPLFVRTAQGMVPTPMAQNIIGPVRNALQLLRVSVQESRSFDPLQASKTFRISMTDLTEALLFPLLFQRLRATCFDPDHARVLGLSTQRTDLALLALIVTVTVAGLQAVGLILIVALLVLPAATARLLTFRLPRLLLLSASLGALSGIAGAAASAVDREDPKLSKLSAMAKCFATDVAMAVATDAVQVFGGYGFMEDYPVAKFFRDAKVLEIGEGTSEVQRMLIARGRGLPVE